MKSCLFCVAGSMHEKSINKEHNPYKMSNSNFLVNDIIPGADPPKTEGSEGVTDRYLPLSFCLSASLASMADLDG